METSSCNSPANFSPDLAKLFIGGINETLKEEEIKGYFSKFGEVKEVVVVKDRASGVARGFGFVEFAGAGSAERALNEKEHAIGERKVEVKRARPRGEQRMNYPISPYPYAILSPHENQGLSNNATYNQCLSENPMKYKKIFVGGLSSNITEDEFRGYFEKFGRITDVVIIYDTATQRPRGFGFITFDSAEAVDYVLQKKFHELNNKRVEVKVAVPKDNNNNQSNYGDSNGVGYNFSMSGGRGPVISNYQGGIYPPYSPRYPGYAPPVPGFYYGTGGYVGPYNAMGYGLPFPSARIPWSGPGMMAARRSPVPYGNASMYGHHYSTGFGNYAGMAGGGAYRGYMWSGDDKSSQMGTDVSIAEEGARIEEVGNEKSEAQQES